MDLMGEEQLDYGEEDYGGSQKMPPFPGAIPALAEEEEEEEEEEEMLMPEDEDYDDLYNDVNVGEGFMQTLQRQQQQPPAPAPFGNGALPPNHKPVPLGEVAIPVPVPAPAAEQKSVAGFPPVKGFEEGSGNSNRVGDMVPEPQGNLGFRVAPRPAAAPPQIGGGGDPKFANAPSSLMMDPGGSAVRGAPPMAPNRAGLMGNRPEMNENTRMMVDNSNGPTMLYVGELHWWTTDADLESMASQYGRVKEIKFFDERASGKSKGYCQLEFYDPLAAAACKEGMNGYLFNGRACVVTFASAQTLRQMGASYTNKNQPPAQLQQQQQQQQGRRPMNDGMGRAGGMNFQGGDGGRRGGWGRGGQGFNNRNQAGNGPMRGRGGVPGAKGMMGPGGAVGAGAPYGQGLAGPGLGGPAGGMMHAQNMLGAGYDPTYMGRGGPYGGFSTPGFPGMMPSFQAVNAVGLHGVAPHVNPAFFGRGMSANGMGIIGSSGMEGHSAGMWMDPSMGSWVGEEHGRGTRESSYGGDDGASDYGYGEVNHERVGKSNPPREKERGSEREWSGNSERRHRDEKERDWDRSDRERYREEKDGYRDSRQRDRDRDNDDNYDRGQSSSRSRSKMQEEDHRSRSRDTDYGKRRRPSE